MCILSACDITVTHSVGPYDVNNNFDSILRWL